MAPFGGGVSEFSSIAVIASLWVRLCPVDQFVKPMLTLERIGMIWNPIRNTVPGSRNLSGIDPFQGTR